LTVPEPAGIAVMVVSRPFFFLTSLTTIRILVALQVANG
jgi:hypothetical protein